jgi:hypothetical protein
MASSETAASRTTFRGLPVSARDTPSDPKNNPGVNGRFMGRLPWRKVLVKAPIPV